MEINHAAGDYFVHDAGKAGDFQWDRNAWLLQSTIDANDIAYIASLVKCECDHTDFNNLVFAMIEPRGLGIEDQSPQWKSGREDAETEQSSSFFRIRYRPVPSICRTMSSSLNTAGEWRFIAEPLVFAGAVSGETNRSNCCVIGCLRFSFSSVGPMPAAMHPPVQEHQVATGQGSGRQGSRSPPQIFGHFGP